MKIYIQTATEEIVTENPVLVTLLTKIHDKDFTEDKNALVQTYDAKVIELFGEGARHLGSEQ